MNRLLVALTTAALSLSLSASLVQAGGNLLFNDNAASGRGGQLSGGDYGPVTRP